MIILMYGTFTPVIVPVHFVVPKRGIMMISWDGEDDPENPLNWSQSRKWMVTFLVSCFTFISPFSSTMVAPVLDDMNHDFDLGDGFSRTLAMSIFLLGYAQGPFVLAPLSEIYGRVSVLQYANLIYLAFNTACGFATNRTQMLVFRVLAGIGGSAPQALCNGVLADVWRKEERGKGQAIYGMLTFTGPTVAPIAGAFISQKTTWRWVFWSTSAFDVVVQLLALLFLRETYAPRILARKAARIRREESGGNRDVRAATDTTDKTVGRGVVGRRLVLPFVMLVAHPAVQLPSLYRAFMYGVMYLVLFTFNEVWEENYDLDKGTASLHYLSICIGFIIGLQISHPLMDRLYAHFKAHHHHPTECLPEWRIPPMIIGGILPPIGLALYGWSTHLHWPWIVADVACALFAAGLIVAFQSAQAYVVDAYGASHAASAAAVGAFLRTMCGFSFPLFAPALYARLGLGWGNSLLAGLTLVVGVPSLVLFWFFGARIRGWSRAGLA